MGGAGIQFHSNFSPKTLTEHKGMHLNHDFSVVVVGKQCRTENA